MQKPGTEMPGLVANKPRGPRTGFEKARLHRAAVVANSVWLKPLG